ncbi:MAG: DNA repair protein RecO [Gammaproteobacteria bacterium]|nr:DNA repair protein RecO [Gammaproteobacteria bacterium]
MKVEQQPAYVLHTRPFSESSLLVDMFSREHGWLMLLAKGARRAKSRTRGLLLPFRPLLASWAGKGKLPVLTGLEADGPPAGEVGGGLLASGFYLNELLMRLLHRHDAHELVFEHYDRALRQLANAEPPRAVLRVFEKKILLHTGFGAALERDADSGERIAPELHYHYVFEKGPVRARDQIAEPSAQNGGAPGIPISGRALCALREEIFSAEDELRDAQRLTRALLDRQLRGRELRSRRVARDMRRFARGD